MAFQRESEVFGAIKRRFRAPTYAVLPGVADATGAKKQRTVDAIAMGLWPSRGLHVHGIEIKTRRSDWLRELRMPEKQETVYRYCDRFWLAVGHKDVVRDGELPDTWGLLVPHGKGLRAVVDAPALDSEPLTRGFVAAILRRAHEAQVDPELEAKIRDELRSEYEKSAKDLADIAEQSTKTENKELRRRLKHLQRLEGIERALRMSQWTTDFEIENVCELVRSIGSLSGRFANRIDSALNHLSSIVENLEKVKETLKTLEESDGG